MTNKADSFVNREIVNKPIGFFIIDYIYFLNNSNVSQNNIDLSSK